MLSRETLDDDAWDELEDTLLLADVGVTATHELVDHSGPGPGRGHAIPPPPRRHLREESSALSTRHRPHARSAAADGRPGVVLVVGVNGTGKTTTTGKLARVLVADGRPWCSARPTPSGPRRPTNWSPGASGRRAAVRGPEGGDPAASAFDAVKRGIADGADAVLIDTAGRLHTKAGLMDELGKVKRVIEKQAAVDEMLLVLDATTGQNGLVQARVFAEVVDITGIVLTKLDGTAKGGIVIAVQRSSGPGEARRAGRGCRRPGAVRAEEFIDACWVLTRRTRRRH